MKHYRKYNFPFINQVVKMPNENLNPFLESGKQLITNQTTKIRHICPHNICSGNKQMTEAISDKEMYEGHYDFKQY